MITIKYTLLATALFSFNLFGSFKPEIINSNEQSSELNDEIEYEPISHDDVGDIVQNEKNNKSFLIPGLGLTILGLLGAGTVFFNKLANKAKQIETNFESEKAVAKLCYEQKLKNIQKFKDFMISQFQNENYYLSPGVVGASLFMKCIGDEPYFNYYKGKNNVQVPCQNIEDICSPSLKNLCNKVLLKNNLLTFVKKSLCYVNYINTTKTELRSEHDINSDIRIENSKFVYNLLTAKDFRKIHADIFVEYKQNLFNRYVELNTAQYHNEIAKIEKKYKEEKAKFWFSSFSSKKFSKVK